MRAIGLVFKNIEATLGDWVQKIPNDPGSCEAVEQLQVYQRVGHPPDGFAPSKTPNVEFDDFGCDQEY